MTNDETLAWLSVWNELRMIVYDSADATATPSSPASLKSRIFYLSDAILPRLF